MSAYVKSVNGKTGDAVLYASSIRVTGSTGNTIRQEMESIAANMRPLIIKQIDNDNYMMCVESGIPFQPVE